MSSLDLSEFFKNDDSDGHRLAEFLHKRRGGDQRPDFVYLNYETQRKSLHVQLEKLPDKIAEKLSDKDEINKQNLEQNPKSKLETSSASPSTSLLPAPIINLSNEGVPPTSPVKSSGPLNPQSPSRPLCPSKSLSPSRPISPRLSVIRKSGGIVSPGDRLRRLSLKRLTSKAHVGRRTLLQEFESTINDACFEPPVCSTPLSEPLLRPTSPSTICSPGNAENVVPNSSNKLPSSLDPCCSNNELLIKSLHRKDEELKNYMGILETTLKNIQQHEKDRDKNNTNGALPESNSKSCLQTAKSPLKRTFILEKGQSPGQVILTRDRSVEGGQGPSKIQQTSNKVMKTPDRSLNRSKISITVKSPFNKCTSPQRSSHSLRHTEESSNRNLSRSIVNVDKSLPTTPLNCSLPNDGIQDMRPCPEDVCVEIPETQDDPLAENRNCILIQSNHNTNMSVVIIPENENCISSKTECPINNNTVLTVKPKSTHLLRYIQENQNKPEDNLKLTDILTDDDDDFTPRQASISAQNNLNNNSQAPLNLAPSATNVRTRRLRKRSLPRRRLQMDNSQLLSRESEKEPPTAHSSNSAQHKRIVKRKNIPLNRAPGVPLNGEKFALELKRMSNYEILDLRKRNSMGRVFPISGRKSSRLQEAAEKKQLQLDDEIEMELLRRTLQKSTSNKSLRHTKSPENVQNNTQEDIAEEFIPVPQEFRDNSHEQETKEHVDSSLLDEKSIDRISFKTNKRSSLRKSIKRKVKTVPKELKKYLEVSKILKQKSHKSRVNQSKRSLYTQGNSDNEDTSFQENVELDKSTNRKTTKQSSDKTISIEMQSLPQVPSPPPSEHDHMPALRVASPPPPLTISLIELQTQDVQANHDEPLPPPPSEFDTVTGVSSKPCSRQHSPMKQKPSETLSNMEKDENVFKRPLTPKTKKEGRRKKSKAGDLLLNDMHTAQDTSTDSSLRRSKRQVPAQPAIPIFQILYQQSFNRRLHNMEKNHARQKQRLKEMSKATLGDNSTINSIISTNSTKLSTRKPPKNLDTIPEDETLMASLEKDMAILNKKKQIKTLKQSKTIRRKNKNNQRTDEQLECSRIHLTTPPPVDHFNNVFDHLRDTSTVVQHDNKEASPPLQQEIQQHQKQQKGNENISNCKKLSVRIKRFQSYNSKEESKGNIKTSTTNTNKQLLKYNSTSTKNNVSSSSALPSPSPSPSPSVVSVASNQSNIELISWLKNITEAGSMERNSEIFKEMRISSASNLSFSTIQGVEYAFYDTEEKASLGYLRFKPGQKKPKKRAKRYHLHFVTLVGQFRITANDKESRVGPGDMIAIEKSVYYDIENITDDIGILMVVKK